MNNVKLPVGISDFHKLRQNEYYYVDNIEYRNKNGNFKSTEDIELVEGLSLIMRKVIIDNCYV